ncbi:urease accessory protein UreF [Salinisphaera hydrothermalis]|uniref:Urease accessory protein UreF n=1 Tax=Salinisphaera hydrothermalis (strain C41B8) TaxID=1304275 RepID=A0A084IRH5_SALHC|nr:urease accessory UreF family protein [Salinisphaera hydrothermalis]KEZ79309.1 Urease accessory protein UreF [Salinisphaera hydrothermalis C41B8]
MAEADEALALQRLLQLASPSLPVGAFAYSEGLEAAVERGWLRHERDVRDWLAASLEATLVPLDLAIYGRLHVAWEAGDIGCVQDWSRYLLTSRETAERRAQERHLGHALATLLDGMGEAGAADWRIGGAQADDVSFAALWALAATRWRIDARSAASGLAWAWLENQVLAAVKLVPLGQTRGQILLFELAQHVPAAVARAFELTDKELGGSLPGVTLASTAHETMYSRLYRS